jgi:hypothetical protein
MNNKADPVPGILCTLLILIWVFLLIYAYKPSPNPELAPTLWDSSAEKQQQPLPNSILEK